MTDQSRDDRETTNRERDEQPVRGGEGRKDEVGGDLVAHRDARSKPINRKTEQKSDLSSGSEFLDSGSE